MTYLQIVPRIYMIFVGRKSVAPLVVNAFRRPRRRSSAAMASFGAVRAAKRPIRALQAPKRAMSSHHASHVEPSSEPLSEPRLAITRVT
jgi:hypothetical protein